MAGKFGIILERKKEKKMFAIAYDGFIQPARYATIEEASIRYERDVKNRFLYEYDCGIAECDENGKFVRWVNAVRT